MKKFLLFIIFSFFTFSNIYSIEKYTIDSVKVKINNAKYDTCYVINEWQKWQAVHGYLIIDREKSKIVLSFNTSKNYIYVNEKLEKYDYNLSLDCFYTNESYILSIYVYDNNSYFYILDEYNQFEIIYKIKK